MVTQPKTSRVRADTSDASPLLALVAAARAGDREAWNTLVEHFTPLLWSVARRYRLDPTDAADVVQVTWLRCVENLHRVRDPAALPGWLVTICRHESVRLLRSKAVCAPVGDEGLSFLLAAGSGEADDPAAAVLRDERDGLLHDAVAALPDRQRRLMDALLHTDGDRVAGAYTQIAGSLGMPVGSVGPTRQRAQQRLRQDPRLQGI